MKFRHRFGLMVALIFLFSLGFVAASDNMTSDEVCFVDDSFELLSDDLDVSESHDTLKDPFSSENVDLSVNVTKLSKDLDNTTIVEVPFNVIASVSGGTAYNTKIHIIYNTVDDDFKYFTHNATLGTYDSATGIWDIGDLSSSDKARLTIVTKFDTGGRNLSSIGMIVIANATTTSHDADLSNNFLIQSVVYAAPIYYTEESEDKEGAQHNYHQSSEASSSVVVIIDEENGGNSSNSQNSEGKVQSDVTSNSNSKNIEDSKSNLQNGIGYKSNSNSVAKEINQNIFAKAINSLTDSIPNVSNSLSDVITNIFNPDANSNDNRSDNLSKSVEGIESYDYTKVPILIFSLFLVILIGLIGYDKFKS